MRTDHHHRLMEAHREEMSELRSVLTLRVDKNAFLNFSVGGSVTFWCGYGSADLDL
jgi:hypothetical protein